MIKYLYNCFHSFNDIFFNVYDNDAKPSFDFKIKFHATRYVHFGLEYFNRCEIYSKEK